MYVIVAYASCVFVVVVVSALVFGFCVAVLIALEAIRIVTRTLKGTVLGGKLKLKRFSLSSRGQALPGAWGSR